MTFTIGIDIGTTGTKTVLFDVQRGIVAQASRSATLYSDAAGHAEADPAEWLSNVHASIREVVVRAGVAPESVVAVSATGMVPAVVLADASGRPLRRAILQNDARATHEIEVLAPRLADVNLVEVTGSALTQQSVAPTAMWLAAHEPDVWQRTVHVLGSYDWVLMALGADPHVEQNWALESGLFTLDLTLVSAVVEASGIGATRIPRAVVSGERIGTLSAAAADATGLQPGTALVVGGADHVLSAYAAGVNQPGDALVKLGGAGDILVASDAAVTDARLYLDAHPVPGRWLPNGCMATSGSLIRWFQTMVGGIELTTLDGEAQQRPPADVLCLPYFLGEKSPLHDPDLRGAFMGLHLGHDRSDLYRAVLESIAFGFRHHVEVFEDIGIGIKNVMVTNGGSKSVLWKQIHADVLGVDLHPVVDHPGASLGAAVIAAVGTGVLDELTDVDRYLSLGPPVVPDPGRAERYTQAYQEWRALGEALTPLSHHHARSTRP
jgi:xylulokinase